MALCVMGYNRYTHVNKDETKALSNLEETSVDVDNAGTQMPRPSVLALSVRNAHRKKDKKSFQTISKEDGEVSFKGDEESAGSIEKGDTNLDESTELADKQAKLNPLHD